MKTQSKISSSKTFAFFTLSLFAFFTSSVVYADSSSSGVVHVAPVIMHSVPIMTTPALQVGQSYNNLPTCPSTPSNCPTVSTGTWPSTCPSACIVSRSPIDPSVKTSSGITYVDPKAQIIMPKCPTGYVVISVFNMQPEVGISTTGFTGPSQMVNSQADYNTFSSLSFFSCTSTGGGESRECGSPNYSTNQVLAPPNEFSSTSVAYITNVYSGNCGCAGSCSSTCSCSVADTPRKWYVDWTLKQCQLVVPAGGEYLTGNVTPASTVCGYQLAPTTSWSTQPGS